MVVPTPGTWQNLPRTEGQIERGARGAEPFARGSKGDDVVPQGSTSERPAPRAARTSRSARSARPHEGLAVPWEARPERLSRAKRR